MVASVKRKRPDDVVEANGAEPSTSKKLTTSVAAAVPTWPDILRGIQGDKGEPGAISALHQLNRVLRAQTTKASTKKPASDVTHLAYSGFLEYWQTDPTLKILVAAWERGDQANNTDLTVAVLQSYAVLLNIALDPATLILETNSPHQKSLSQLLNGLIDLLHFATKYLGQHGKNDLVTASLELVIALLRVAKLSPARSAVIRRIWLALNVDARVLNRLLSTRRKVPLVTKSGRQPDIRHLALTFSISLLSPTVSTSLRIDILALKGLTSSIWRGLADDPVDVVEDTLECIGLCIASDRIPLDTRCHLAEEGWAEIIKIVDKGATLQMDASSLRYTASQIAARYITVVTAVLSRPATGQSSTSPAQRKCLGSLVGHLNIHETDLQADIALNVLSQTPDLLPGFWSRFVASLEPRLSSRWVSSVSFATRLVASAVPSFARRAKTMQDEEPSEIKENRGGRRFLVSLVDCALIPGHSGKLAVSKALQMYDTAPLVAYLACVFLYASLMKCRRILQDSAVSATAITFLRSEMLERLPDLQILVALAQKTLGRNFARGGSVASTMPSEDGSTDQPATEDNAIFSALVLRTIHAYYSVASQAVTSARFDLAKLFHSPIFEKSQHDADAVPCHAIAQTALLDMIAGGAAEAGITSWSWHKSSDNQHSPLYSIMSLAVRGEGLVVEETATRATQALLASSILFEPSPEEALVWLNAIPRRDAQETAVCLSFLENCIQRALQTPFKYIERALATQSGSATHCNESDCRAASPLMACLAEQAMHQSRVGASLPAISAFFGRLGAGLRSYQPCSCQRDIFLNILRQNHVGKKDDIPSTEHIAQMLSSSMRGCDVCLAPAHKRDPLEFLSDLSEYSSKSSKLALSGLLVLVETARASLTDVMVVQLAAALWNIVSTSVNDDVAQAQFAGVAAAFKGILSGRSPFCKRRVSRMVSQMAEVEGLSKLSATRGTAAQATAELLVAAGASSLALQNMINAVLTMLSGPGIGPKGHGQWQQTLALLAASAPRDLQLQILERLLGFSDRTHHEVVASVCRILLHAEFEDAIANFIENNWRHLMASLAIEEPRLLLAKYAAATLPSQVASRIDVAIPTASLHTPPSWLKEAAAFVLKPKGGVTAGTAQLLTVAVYCHVVDRSQLQEALTAADFDKVSRLAVAWVETVDGTRSTEMSSLRLLLQRTSATFLTTSDDRLRGRCRQVLWTAARRFPGTHTDIHADFIEKLVQAAPQNSHLYSPFALEYLSLATQSSLEGVHRLHAFASQSLLWLVRRFAEDADNSEAVSQYLPALTTALMTTTELEPIKAHLAEPVLDAGIRNRLRDPESLNFLSALVMAADLGDASLSKHIAGICAHQQFRESTTPGSKSQLPLSRLLSTLHSKLHDASVQSNIASALLSVFEGSVSGSDQNILGIIRKAEAAGLDARALIRSWFPASHRSLPSTSIGALSNLQRGRMVKAGVACVRNSTSIAVDDDDAYDPDFMLSYLNCLLDAAPGQRSFWMATLSSGILGLAITALSSRHVHLARAGDRILAKARNALQDCDFAEKLEVMAVLDAARNVLDASAGITEGPSPLITTFLSRAMTSISHAEDSRYPLIWRLILSRPSIDAKDVPLLYNLFYSASVSPSEDRKWLLDLLIDGLHTYSDWRILRRRQVVDLLASLAMSTVADGDLQERESILRVFAHVSAIPGAARDLVVKHDIFTTLSMIPPSSSAEADLLLRCLDQCVSAIDVGKLRRARDGLWILAAMACIESATACTSPSLEATRSAARTCRRLSWHIGQAQEPATIETVTEPLVGCISKTLSANAYLTVESIRDFHDAALRLLYAWSRSNRQPPPALETLVYDATDLALREDLYGMREEVIHAMGNAALNTFNLPMSNADPSVDANNSGRNNGDAASPAAPGTLPVPATATTPTTNNVTFQQMQQQRGSLSWVSMLAFFMFMMTGGGPGTDDTTETTYRSALARLTQERDDFERWLFPQRWNSTTSRDIIVTSVINSAEPLQNDTLPGNHTDFVLTDLTPPEVIRPQVLDLLTPQFDTTHPLFYRNVSGFFKGSWNLRTDVNVSDNTYNETEIADRRGHFPWNGLSTRKNVRDGKVVRLNVREVAPHEKGADPDEESHNAAIVIIRGSLELQLHDMLASNTSTSQVETRTNEIDLEGVHFVHNGSFFMHAAAPWKDLDMRQLPGLLLTNQSRNESAQTVLKELNARLGRIQDAIDTSKYPDVGGGSDGDRNMNCSFSIYGQLQPLPRHIKESQLRDREREIRQPSGISLPYFPTPVVDGIVFSKDCNLVIELDRMEVLELDVFWSKALTYAFVLAILTAIQTWVLIRQMEYTATPASISKVSHLTISMQVVLDVYFCVTHLTLGIVTQNRSSLALLIPGFFGILAGLLFGLRYAAIIRVHSYRPTPAPAAIPTTAAISDNAAMPSIGSGVTTPLLAGNRTTQNVSDANAAPSLAAFLFAIGALSFIGAIMLFGWFPLLLTLAYSFWLPQIYHNAERGTSRHALLKQYVVATSAVRLFIPLYVWTCPQNLLFTETSPWVFGLVAWQAFQIIVLFLQDWFGPRFFLPRGVWFEEQETWDYHPALPPDDIESSGKADGKREVDCIICLEAIELAPGRLSVDQRVADKETSGAVGDVISGVKRGANRLSYMVPPCHHIAHTSCLETWAAQKMECPLCRRPLPPF